MFLFIICYWQIVLLTIYCFHWHVKKVTCGGPILVIIHVWVFVLSVCLSVCLSVRLVTSAMHEQSILFKIDFPIFHKLESQIQQIGSLSYWLPNLLHVCFDYLHIVPLCCLFEVIQYHFFFKVTIFLILAENTFSLFVKSSHDHFCTE